MSCHHCGAVEQRGRFCVGCGKRMPPEIHAVPPVRLALGSEREDDLPADATQRVLRFPITDRMPVPATR